MNYVHFIDVMVALRYDKGHLKATKKDTLRESREKKNHAVRRGVGHCFKKS